MIFPKLTRKRIYAAGGKPIEIAWPKGEPKAGHSYVIESKVDGRRKSHDDKVQVKAVRQHGEGWRATVILDADPIRLLGRRSGYTSSMQGSITTRHHIDSAIVFRPEMEPEAVDEFTQRRITEQARARDRESVGELLAALEDLREAVKDRLEMNPDARRIMGRDAWALRSKIDSVERRLKRRHAA